MCHPKMMAANVKKWLNSTISPLLLLATLLLTISSNTVDIKLTIPSTQATCGLLAASKQMFDLVPVVQGQI